MATTLSKSSFKTEDRIVKKKENYPSTQKNSADNSQNKKFKVDYLMKLNNNLISCLVPTISESNIWKLYAIFDDEKIEKEKPNFETLEQLAVYFFEKSDMIYYTDIDKKYLFSFKNELYEHDFGQLYPISILEAFLKYGLDVVEEAGERGLTRI